MGQERNRKEEREKSRYLAEGGRKNQAAPHVLFYNKSAATIQDEREETSFFPSLLSPLSSFPVLRSPPLSSLPLPLLLQTNAQFSFPSLAVQSSSHDLA